MQQLWVLGYNCSSFGVHSRIMKMSSSSKLIPWALSVCVQSCVSPIFFNTQLWYCQKSKLRCIFRSTKMIGKSRARKQAKTPDQHVLTFYFRKCYSNKYNKNKRCEAFRGLEDNTWREPSCLESSSALVTRVKVHNSMSHSRSILKIINSMPNYG